MKMIEFKGKSKNVIIGEGKPIAVNINLGVSSENTEDMEVEKKKIYRISQLDNLPDLMMDLSLTNSNGYLYEYIKEYIGCPIGIIPHYYCLNETNVIDKKKLIYEMERAASNGVSWFVIHLTPTKERILKALNTRKIPFSSRSATIIIKDMIMQDRVRSVYWDVIDDIVEICKKYKVNISLGSAFRAAITNEALDDVHCDELLAYRDIIKIFHNEGISVFTEGIGHCDINKIDKFINITNKTDVPIMPLGPLFRNLFNRDDDISNAIAFYLSISKGAKFKIINSITSEEHSGGIPSIDNIVKGYNVARSCADMCNEYLNLKASRNGKSVCTIIGENYKGCNRCDQSCPTKFVIENKNILFEWLNKDDR
ncbi:MAG: phosphomethylpyrimidine synthase ThiC [Clostridium sp.]|uniref:phosphomethylpyrimidine synthase ThiC n=1 Tax=Clostridium sp. TaxID=1506 RepID=UPI002900B621|nr:phosphomethylpyrimidine synthase ThiC [Clostridium sp.]MDU1603147.1 phosphomethylpyrimidine synthase ThiC [Clostridium sp.]